MAEFRATSIAWRLCLARNAQLEGGVIAEEVRVRGRLIGPVRALRVRLQPGSHVEGCIYHKSLSVEQGAHFEGESHPTEDPLSFSLEGSVLAPKPRANNERREVKPHEPAKRFIRSLSESRSA